MLSLKKFINDEKGLETAEKAVLTVLGLAIAVGGMTQLAPALKAAFTKLADALQ